MTLQFSYGKSENEHCFGVFDNVRVVTWPFSPGLIGPMS